MKTIQQTLSVAIAVASILALSTAMAADDASTIPDYANETISGDWGGLRPRLFKAGVGTEFGWKVDALANLTGGIRHGGTAMGNLDSKLKFDLDKLAGWNDTTAFLHILANQGGKANARQVGSLLGVSNIEVPSNTVKVFQGWVQKQYGNLALLVGLYPIDTEFQVVDSAGIFIQPPYGATGELALTRGPSIFNTSSFGTRIRWTAADQSIYSQFALLDGIPGDPRNPKGTHIRFDKGDGSFAIAEFGWTPQASGHAFESGHDAAKAKESESGTAAVAVAAEKVETIAKYALGLWRYSAHVDHLAESDAVGNPQRVPSWGGYLLAERTLFRLNNDPARRLTAFFRYSMTDGRSSPLRDSLNLGLNFKGPVAGREDDALGIALTRGRIGNAWSKAESIAGNDPVDAEYVSEITYRAQVNRKFSLQPVWQHFRHPGGYRSTRDADVVGARLEFVL